MKELTKVDNILNEYIINDTELSSKNEYLLTQQSVINSKLNLKLQNQRNISKNNPLNKYCHNTSSYIKKPSQKNDLIKSIQKNNIRKVKEILNKDLSNINRLNKNGISPLHIAVIHGNLEIINLLLEKGANPNIASWEKKQTPLHYSYIFKNMKANKIRNLLLKYNANPNLEDINNKKPKEYSLKYKESSDVDNYTSSNENEIFDENLQDKNNKNIENYCQFSDNEINNKKNTYTISDSEETIIQEETKKNNLYNIEELINFDKTKYSTKKIKIISKKNINNDIEYYRKIKEESKSMSNNKITYSSKEKDTYNDSLEINTKNYSKYTYNRSLNHIKLKTRKIKKNTSPKNLKLNKNLLLKISERGCNTLKTENNTKKEININKQYFINNEFFNNYYNGQEDCLKSKIARRLFKIPKKQEKKNNNNGILSTSIVSTNIQTSKKFNNLKTENNNVAEFVYTDENNETKNQQRLKNWLDSLQLSLYYDNFVNNGITDINKLINEYKANRDKINYQYIEKLLNIHTSGHIYRILSKLEIDGSFVENKIATFLLGINGSINDESTPKKNLSKLFIQSDECSDTFYNCCNRKKTIMEKNDLKYFLRKYRIYHLYNYFYHNGFDLINFVILQMFTKFVINDEIIQKSLHIYNKKDRYLVLDALFNEVKEINIFFSSNIYNFCLFPSYENNDWGINWNEESINEENENSKECIIF